MIQIDMPMPEKCEGCIFCDDNCSCVASDYDGIGINVGCAYRTGRRDIRCPLKEQEAVEARKENDGNPQPWTCWWYVCGDCGQEIYYHERFCRWCGRAVKWE